jgi:4-azaleucine resistance transporter AzlC
MTGPPDGSGVHPTTAENGVATEPRIETTGDESDATAPERPVTFTGFRAGFVTCLPVALGVGAYGLVFGVLANQAGLSVAEATLMSATVLAGAAQLVAVDLWAAPVPAATVVGATLVVNLRYVLLGATLRPWLGELSLAQRYASAFFTADENWALTVRDLRSGSGRGAFLLGSGLAIWAFWVAATVAGSLAGAAVGDPARYGLDFVLTAVFLVITVDLWDGTGDLLPWGVALAVALTADAVLAGKSYILLGGFAGGLAEVARDGR